MNNLISRMKQLHAGCVLEFFVDDNQNLQKDFVEPELLRDRHRE